MKQLIFFLALLFAPQTMSQSLGPIRYVDTVPDVMHLLAKGSPDLAMVDLPRPAVFVANDQFGSAVAVSDNFIAVAITNDSSPDSSLGSSAVGRINFYRRDGDRWIDDGFIFGLSDVNACAALFSLRFEGDRLFIASPKEADTPPPTVDCLEDTQNAVVYVAERCPGGPWRIGTQITQSDFVSFSGFGAAIGVSDDMIAIGAPAEDEGVVRLFQVPDFEISCASSTINPVTADLVDILRPPATAKGGASTRFGQSLSFAKGTLAVGAPGQIGSAIQGSLSLYQTIAGSLQPVMTMASPSAGSSGDAFGQSIALDGNMLAVGAPGDSSQSGAVHVFDISANSTELNPVRPPIPPPPGQASLAARFGFQVGFFDGSLFATAPGLLFPGGKGAASGGVVRVDLGSGEAMVADSGGEGLGQSMETSVTTLAAGAPETAGGLGSARAILDTQRFFQSGFEG